MGSWGHDPSHNQIYGGHHNIDKDCPLSISLSITLCVITIFYIYYNGPTTTKCLTFMILLIIAFIFILLSNPLKHLYLEGVFETLLYN